MISVNFGYFWTFSVKFGFLRPRKPQGGKNEAECSIDAHETNPESWNMNCPDSCEIMEFLDVVEKRIAEEWAMVKSK